MVWAGWVDGLGRPWSVLVSPALCRLPCVVLTLESAIAVASWQLQVRRSPALRGALLRAGNGSVTERAAGGSLLKGESGEEQGRRSDRESASCANRDLRELPSRSARVFSPGRAWRCHGDHACRPAPSTGNHLERSAGQQAFVRRLRVPLVVKTGRDTAPGAGLDSAAEPGDL